MNKVTKVTGTKVVKSAKAMTQKIAESKAKTLAARALNKAKNQALKSETKPKPARKKIDLGAVYLAEGVTGKQFMQAKRDTNNNVKKYRASISQCIADAKLKDVNYFSSLNLSNNALKAILKPSVIIQHATNYQLLQMSNSLEKFGYIRFNVWNVLGYLKAELDGRKVNAKATEFFSLIKTADEVTTVTDAARLAEIVAEIQAIRDAKKK